MTQPDSPSSFRQVGRGLLGLILVGLVAAALAGCADDGESDAVDAQEGGTIGTILIGNNQYVQCLATGVISELEGTPWRFTGLYSDFAAPKEVANFDSMETKGVEGLLVLPVTPQSAARGAISADASGTPVVNLAWAQETSADDVYAARVQIDNIEGGRMIAKWLGENAEPGKILVVEGQRGNEFNDQLLEGLREGVASLGGDWRIAGVEQGLYLRDAAITAAQDLMTAHPDARIVVDFAAEMGVGIASFLEREGRDDIVHVTSDGNPEMASWMEKGYIDAVRFYSSAEEGRIGARLLLDALDGKTSGVTQVPMSMETPDTIEAALEQTPLCYREHLKEARSIS